MLLLSVGIDRSADGTAGAAEAPRGRWPAAAGLGDGPGPRGAAGALSPRGWTRFEWTDCEGDRPRTMLG